MKKVLIITYYWPPAGGPGVQRVLKFAKYLPQFGWKPVILTVKNGEYPAIDKSLLMDIPDGIKIYKTKTFEPFALYKILSKKKGKKIETFTLTESKSSLLSRIFKWIRLNLFIPDARVGWNFYASKTGIDIIEKENIDLIFSSSPPHSLQLAAKKIAKKTQTPWVADFRDLWLDAFYIPNHEQSRFARNRNTKLEKKVLKAATHISTTSQEIRQNFISKSGQDNISIVYNGFDSTDFSITTEKNDTDSFIIRYFGFLSSGQNPRSLYSALNEIKTNYPDIFDRITLELYGKIDNEVKKSIVEFKLENTIKNMGYVNHNKVPGLMSSSDCLLLLLPKGKYKGMVPGKLFEYFAAQTYILAIGNTESEVSEMLNQTNSGRMYNHEDNITGPLLTVIKNHNKLRNSINNEAIDFYTRESQTKILAELFNKTIQQL